MDRQDELDQERERRLASAVMNKTTSKLNDLVTLYEKYAAGQYTERELVYFMKQEAEKLTHICDRGYAILAPFKG